MTDEERQKLCKELRTSEGWYHLDGILMGKAADDIERLASDLNFEREAQKIQQREIEHLSNALAEARRKT